MSERSNTGEVLALRGGLQNGHNKSAITRYHNVRSILSYLH